MGAGHEVTEQLFGQMRADRDVVETGVGSDANERAFELTDVAGDPRRDEFEGVRGDGAAITLRLVAKDREPGLEVGRLDVGDQAPLETTAQTFFERGDRIGHPIARHHDLLVGAVERVEGVEELLLQAFLAFHELDVVDQEHVDVAKASLEVGDRVGSNAVDVLVQERLGAHIANDVVLVVVVHVVADGVQQVRLAQAGRPVDEERVVAPTGGLGHPKRRSQGELVRCTLDEGLEGVSGVQASEVERLGRSG